MKKLYSFILAVLAFIDSSAQSHFITRWDLSKEGSAHNEIRFSATTTGTVSYSWQEVSPGTASGAGTFNGSAAIITDLPTGAVVDLNINPLHFNHIAFRQNTDPKRLVDIRQWGTTSWSSMSSSFFGCSNLQISATDTPDLSAVSNMSDMFSYCTELNGPTNIGTWNTGKVTNMSALFNNCTKFNQSLEGWTTDNVTNMGWMFSGATAFNQPIEKWNTAKVTSMIAMFQEATNFNQPIGGWNTANVNDMSFMFLRASKFNQSVGDWNTKKVTTMHVMFNRAQSFNQSIGTWTLNAEVQVTGMLDHTGLSSQNYSATLIGWNANSLTPDYRNLGADGLHYDANAVDARTNLVANKRWTIDGDATNPLPVTLVSFTGQADEHIVSLTWRTTDEKNNAGFDIEKSTDGRTFQKIGFVDGGEDSKSLTSYHFEDLNPTSINYYRLKQLDLDGSFAYSRIISVKSRLSSVIIYPNPAKTEFFVRNIANSTELAIFDNSGKLAFKSLVSPSTPINLNTLPSGIYNVVVSGELRKLVIEK